MKPSLACVKSSRPLTKFKSLDASAGHCGPLPPSPPIQVSSGERKREREMIVTRAFQIAPRLVCRKRLAPSCSMEKEASFREAKATPIQMMMTAAATTSPTSENCIALFAFFNSSLVGMVIRQFVHREGVRVSPSTHRSDTTFGSAECMAALAVFHIATRLRQL